MTKPLTDLREGFVARQIARQRARSKTGAPNPLVDRCQPELARQFPSQTSIGRIQSTKSARRPLSTGRRAPNFLADHQQPDLALQISSSFVQISRSMRQI